MGDVQNSRQDASTAKHRYIKLRYFELPVFSNNGRLHGLATINTNKCIRLISNLGYIEPLMPIALRFNNYNKVLLYMSSVWTLMKTPLKVGDENYPNNYNGKYSAKFITITLIWTEKVNINHVNKLDQRDFNLTSLIYSYSFITQTIIITIAGNITKCRRLSFQGLGLRECHSKSSITKIEKRQSYC